MFSSFLGGSKDASTSGSAASSSSASVGQVHPPKERLTNPDSTFGPLTKEDTSWLCAGGFTVETQTFYAMTGGKNPKFLMVQVIHSAVGMWYPQIQFNFRLYDPVSGQREWRSVNVSNFTTPPTSGAVSYDKRSSKSDQFSILLDPSRPDSYTIEGKYDASTQVSLKFKRAENAPGWKLGSGPKGGFTYFGAEKEGKDGKNGGPAYDTATDGYVIHRFWPRCVVSGIIRVGSEVISLDDAARGVFIHAIQGMRPNLVACRWNFGVFMSAATPSAAKGEASEGSEKEADEGVTLIMMELTTPANYGTKTVNIGSVVIGDRLVAVVSDGTVEHLENDVLDIETGYPAPGKVQWNWNNGRSLLPSMSGSAPKNDTVTAKILLDVAGEKKAQQGQPRDFKGLIEKVDVLAQIPYLVKKVISYVAGTKPYIYTFLNPTTAEITLPSDDGSETRSITVEGTMFNEATFISAS